MRNGVSVLFKADRTTSKRIRYGFITVKSTPLIGLNSPSKNTTLTAIKQAFTLNLKKIESELNKEIADRKELSVLRTIIDDKFQRLDNCQLLLSEELLKEENGEQLFSEDFEEAETYRDRYLQNCFKIENRLQENAGPSEAEKRKFKLPKIELKQFNGDPKEFLAFWSQFKKIHDDSSIAEEDKMQYLLQSVEPHSKAERLVLSFPATAANYSKAIEQLKERFGRDDLLAQIYVRDLLGLVMKNAVKGRSKTDLTYLYGELEEKLRALESLGRTQDKHGDFLIPLVESCLPEETLLVWERSRNHELTQNTRSLGHLIIFFAKRCKERRWCNSPELDLDPSTYNFRNNNAPVECVIQSELATASALVSLDSVPKINDQNILKELRGKNIHLTDSSCEGAEIDLLIGADVMGRLLTGNVVTLHSGLTAVESKLGWTVFGKQKFCGHDKFTTLSMHVGNIPLQNLWELEVLGITDPTETVKEREYLSDFLGKK
ncbi:integrase catalytic domain-containing protein [Trichonephila clavipes]|nr:integrase catalytic domain-containing protein [Trichonephila clavipes]